MWYNKYERGVFYLNRWTQTLGEEGLNYVQFRKRNKR